MKKQFIVLWFVLIVTVVLACQNSGLYKNTYRFDNSSWHKDTIIDFEISNKDTAVIKNSYFEIINTNNYPVANIWLFVTIQSPLGQEVTDTVEYFLATREGKWRGRSVGDAWRVKLPYKMFIKLSEKGQYTIKARHGLRTPTIEGIKQISFILEDALSVEKNKKLNTNK